MTIIADAGSTKIEWVALEGKRFEERLRVTTSGFNAAVSRQDILTEILRLEAPALLEIATDTKQIFYYGAGCTGQRSEATAVAIREAFGDKEIHVESDMLGAARALCGDRPGIACILGTGSNSCLYDGCRITANIPPMGYILGDEGSGAVLGKIFIGRLMKGGFSEEIHRRFAETYPGIDAAEVIARVYRSERPNAFLASFVPFIAANIELPEIEQMVIDEFTRFIETDVLPYSCTESVPVNFAGSIAHHFAPQLLEAAKHSGITVGKIIKSPMDDLIGYHRAAMP